MNWHRLFRNRHFHAAWVGTVLLGLAIWFDLMGVAVGVIFLIGAVVMSVDWLIGLFKPESRRRWPSQD